MQGKSPPKKSTILKEPFFKPKSPRSDSALIGRALKIYTCRVEIRSTNLYHGMPPICIAMLSRRSILSGPISRDTAIPHIARYFFWEVSPPPKWCDTPAWHLFLHRHICAIHHFATYRAMLVRYPIKKTQKNFAIRSLQVSRNMTSIAAWPLRKYH